MWLKYEDAGWGQAREFCRTERRERTAVERFNIGPLKKSREALGSVFSDPCKFYVADPYTFLFASLIVLIFGTGILP